MPFAFGSAPEHLRSAPLPQHVAKIYVTIAPPVIGGKRGVNAYHHLSPSDKFTDTLHYTRIARRANRPLVAQLTPDFTQSRQTVSPGFAIPERYMPQMVSLKSILGKTLQIALALAYSERETHNHLLNSASLDTMRGTSFLSPVFSACVVRS